MIIFESGISSPLSSMYGIWPLLPNFMVNTFSYLQIVFSIYGYSRNLNWFWAFGWQTWCRQVEARSPVWERTERLYGLERDCWKLLHCRIIICVLHCWPLFYDTGKGLLNILFGSCESIAFKVWAPDGQSGNWQRYTTSFSQSVFLKVFKSTAADIWNNLTEVFW